ncbi:hypothetical protein COCCADRAFT_112757 [Bipolaris zeicola 26-R-13]|uniref:Extracellular membrane protein CFEM domain-containing protein n=1 Tax=Cochliobolus carbonum (strain 26-R-13) TaxID=930089 RepID=W6XP40_COCC2|nr:uncharacterized protein COCCADRAFT_112757 [Bipolaris zeicola 26-R-13]EUC27025.1 hypothetical protein COCCADRAFT_112757 [Bipolaris zeicola 26-R-13]
MKLLSATFLAVALLSQLAVAQTLQITCEQTGSLVNKMFCAYTQKETSCVTTCTAEQVRNKAVVSCVCISAPEISGEANFGRLLPVDPTTPASGSNRDNKEEV